MKNKFKKVWDIVFAGILLGLMVSTAAAFVLAIIHILMYSGGVV